MRRDSRQVYVRPVYTYPEKARLLTRQICARSISTVAERSYGQQGMGPDPGQCSSRPLLAPPSTYVNGRALVWGTWLPADGPVEHYPHAEHARAQAAGRQRARSVQHFPLAARLASRA